ncbi:hypothetical protein K525DRAFT_289413 [Schizophyllum commune Loenen D]|nr:hypothetical protein K525DRAFT_289413 [Schizophyllum commune Loenen D]
MEVDDAEDAWADGDDLGVARMDSETGERFHMRRRTQLLHLMKDMRIRARRRARNIRNLVRLMRWIGLQARNAPRTLRWIRLASSAPAEAARFEGQRGDEAKGPNEGKRILPSERRQTENAQGIQANDVSEDSGFNTGWRRFGPRGRDVTDYTPHFHRAPTVQWPSDLTTIGPYIPVGTHKKGARNKLKWDHTYTTTVAKKFSSSRERPDLCMHVKFTNEFDAAKLIRRCMAQGIPLVFDDYPDSIRWAAAANNVDEDPFMNPVRWSDDEVEGVVGADLNTPRDFQDAGVREDTALQPYITATLHDFYTWLKKPGIVRCILDLTCGFPQSDDLMNRIADNVVQSVSQTYGNKYSGHYVVPADMLKTQDWFLLHTSGFLTFGHIDGSGMATSAQIRGSGMKEWMIFKSTKMPTPKADASRRERESLADDLVQRIGDLIIAASNEEIRPPPRKSRGEDSKWQVDGCIIELRPGMKYFQPSGTVHAAYTPVPTAAAGKHFFTYDDLHRVEVARRLQVVKKGITNHNHNCGVQLMLISMAASLPMKARSGRVFYRKPLIALALMLTRPQDYMRRSKRLYKYSWEDDEEEARDGSDDEHPPHTDEEREKENKERRAEWEMTERLRLKRWFKEGTAFDRLARTVALRILNACTGRYPGDKRERRPRREYIFDGETWEDPGPIFDAHGLTCDLVTTHVDDLEKEDSEEDTEEDTESDLTDLDDL